MLVSLHPTCENSEVFNTLIFSSLNMNMNILYRNNMRLFFSESSSYKANEDAYPYMTDKAGYSCDPPGNSALNRKGKLCNTRYFIIKSLNHHNIQLSIEKGIWATQVMNEPILEEAFHVRSLSSNSIDHFIRFWFLNYHRIFLPCRTLVK